MPLLAVCLRLLLSVCLLLLLLLAAAACMLLRPWPQHTGAPHLRPHQ